ncbi:PQQ-dependent dehydrogenase, methanol/ethanol family [uncultured Roseobacter sp.]|uniref:PQQ-dependent dehydrogenase, methanol/ethanol family n=1 Tax=uncultured Roseobacter sp. TaxID=114847 RepID=UPI00260B7453|nr:PQQ-dependent dehydrogenase, methanol/ethanol family [uncultured Roseobacter sp.]
MKTVALSLAMSLGMATGSFAQSAADLQADAQTPQDVLVYGMGYDQKRFSSLDQISTDNVSSLTPVWAYSLADTRGQESFPIIHDGKMYVTTHSATIALDLASGKQLWKSSVEYPAETPRVACCGIVNRGVAILDGTLYRTTLDAHVIAIDAATGEEKWRTQSIDYKQGYSFTVTPLIADGVVIVGISGGEYGIRGYIEGYDPANGERLWRTYTIPAPGEPGSETWPEGDAWKRGGGPGWLTGTYDPELNLVYWGVGNAASWNAGSRPGDNLYTSSALALDPKTGAIQWHYQFSPNDPFDYDGTNELVLAEIDGRKVLMQANRNGFLYVIDRTNGALVAANTFVDDVTWADGVDLTTGRPEHTDVYEKAVAGEPVTYWPSAFGGKNWSPMSYNPDSGTVFVNTLRIGMNYKAVEPKYRAGVFYFGAEFSWDWPEGHRGELRAIDPMTGDVKWSQPADIPRLGGVLSTAGNLVFTGAQTGEFEAFHAETGDKLWSFNTGSGVIGQPVTWEMAGKQYVTVLNGSGGVYALFSGDERLAETPPGGSVWTFALP